MEEILIFQHDPFEDLSVLAEILERWGGRYRVSRLFHGETRTADWERRKALIVLGSPMRVQDQASLPFRRWEKRILCAAIEEKVPILGIGLGAQLASTFGSSIYNGRVKEIGWSSVSISRPPGSSRFTTRVRACECRCLSVAQ
jgi:GMP synthase (glutamine-hydrolysing)